MFSSHLVLLGVLTVSHWSRAFAGYNEYPTSISILPRRRAGASGNLPHESDHHHDDLGWMTHVCCMESSNIHMFDMTIPMLYLSLNLDRMKYSAQQKGA